MARLKWFFKFMKEKIKKIDFFGVSFSFKYKSEEKYSTFLGGIVCLLFSAISIIYFIINLIPFVQSENFTLQFYTMNLNNTEDMRLKESKIAFAFGLTCRKENETKIVRELFNLNLEFILKINQTKQDNESININIHNCTPEDFYNRHNSSFKSLNISDLQCINPNELENHQLQGIYTDDTFTYYKLSVISKDNSTENYNKIDRYLLENDCKLQFYYIDISANLSN